MGARGPRDKKFDFNSDGQGVFRPKQDAAVRNVDGLPVPRVHRPLSMDSIVQRGCNGIALIRAAVAVYTFLWRSGSGTL